MERILFLVDGEPYILEDGIEYAITLNVTECREKIKERFKYNKPNIRPSMGKIWKWIANDIGASTFSPRRCRKTNFSTNSFESILTKEIKSFLDVIYPFDYELLEAQRAHTKFKKQTRRELAPCVVAKINERLRKSKKR